jgi:CRP-like cAMP-binding protein/Zn-dependent protease
VRLATDDRVVLLQAVPGLQQASRAELRRLLVEAREERFSPGAIVISEGEHGQALHVIVSGRAELTKAVNGTPLPLGVVEAGDVVGELAFLSQDRRRAATLTALTRVHVLSLDAPVVERFILAQPRRRRALHLHAESLRVAEFIRRVGVFATLDLGQRTRLAARVVRRVVPAGEVIVRQGDQGQSCFMLQSGVAEVAVADGEHERLLGVLEPGALFGEGVALTGGTRTATIRAQEACELLELGHDELIAVLEDDRAVAQETVYLFRLRERPHRNTTVEVHEHVSDEGDVVTTLRNPGALTYFRLSERGRFVWDRLDGMRTLRELTMEYFAAFAVFDPNVVADVVAALAKAHMLQDDRVATAAPTRRRSAFGRATLAARRLLLWRYEFRRADRLISRLYHHGGGAFFTRAGRTSAWVFSAVAVAAFGADLVAGYGLDHQAGRYALLVIPGVWLTLLVHEVGHALAVKAHGRDVRKAGVGWYWLSPIAYVDTSDMWLADRRSRIAVSLAGPIATLFVAAPLAVAALLTPDPAASAILWALALPIYVSVLVNLCPLLEYDGYYILADLVDRPNLRVEAFAWLGTGLRRSLRDRRELARHRLDMLYLGASFLYLAVAAAVVLVVYRVVLEHWLDALMPLSAANWLAWTVTGLNVALALVLLLDTVRRAE